MSGALRDHTRSSQPVSGWINQITPTVWPLNAITTTPSGAFGLRRLLSSYSGALIKVRRSSDSTTLNIGTDRFGNLDQTALLAFVGANSAYIDTWYDQSGNGRNITQATAANQPRIVNAGTVDTKNNQPCVFFDGSTSTMSYASPQNFTGTGQVSQIAVCYSTNVANTGGYVMSGQDTGTGTRLGQWLWQVNSVTAGYTFNTAGTSFQGTASGISNNTLFVTSTVVSTTSVQVWNNNGNSSGATAVTGTLQTASSAVFSVGRSATGGGNYWSGGLSELVLFPSALSTADRNTIERGQGAYFGVTVA